jgi:hypothetical protein
MIPIDFSNGTVIINLNPKFYDLYYITEVAEKFQNICKIVIQYDRQSDIIITLKPKVEVDIKNLAFEFCNHILHLQVRG